MLRVKRFIMLCWRFYTRLSASDNAGDVAMRDTASQARVPWRHVMLKLCGGRGVMDCDIREAARRM
jgi:hypothetical protein